MSQSVERYVLSLAALSGAVLLRVFLDPVMGDALPLVTLFGAVAVAVWLAGHVSGIAVALLGYFACHYLFISPRGELDLSKVGTVVGLVAYLFTCSLIIGFGEMMRRARSREAAEGEVLRVTLRSIGDAVITTDTDGRVTYLNSVAESLTGFSNAEAMGVPLDRVFRIVNEETRAPVNNPAHQALRDGRIVGLANHTLLIDKNGRAIPIDDSAAPIRDEHGRVSGCVLIFRDVSAQRRVEQERTAQLLTANRLASIVESSDDAILATSLDGTIQSWNAAAERLFGYGADEAIGRHISLVIPHERLAEEDRIIEELRAGRRIEQYETERRHRDGRLLPVSLTISPIRDGDGNVVGASKIVRDITSQKRLTDELRKLASDLTAADRRKNEFVATIAHELRNPLAPLANMMDVLKRTDVDAPTLARARATIDRQLKQLVRLVDDLLDLNRVTHNRLELRPREVLLSTVIDEVLEASKPLLDAAHHELYVDLPDEPIHLVADPARLAQVFGNLVNNACKYTPAGGTIWVRAERQGLQVSVSVKDTGIGIPPEKREAIFEMFTQLDHSLVRTQGGLGIGLTLVKQLVQMHDGSIEVLSPGAEQGSEFLVRLPVRQVTPKQGAVQAVVTSRPPKLKRILVVDDNLDAAQALCMLLELSGTETYLARDGAEAIDAVKKHQPDAVLLDIGLPDRSGLDVCRQIRAEPGGKEIIFIAFTGWGQQGDRRASEDAGFDGHLVKPVDHAELEELLRTIAIERQDAAADDEARFGS